MRAGDLRHRITIEVNAATAQSASGEKLPDWQPYRTFRASIEPQHGGQIDMNQAKTVVSTLSYKICTRYVPGVTPAMRIRFNGSSATPCSVNPRNLAGMTLGQLSESAAMDRPEQRPRYFAINSILNPAMRNIMLVMTCTEAVPP